VLQCVVEDLTVYQILDDIVITFVCMKCERQSAVLMTVELHVY